MSKIEFVLDVSALNEIMKSEEMQQILLDHTSEIASRCGEGYENDVYVGNFTAMSSVYTDTPEAMIDNLENNTLLKNLR